MKKLSALLLLIFSRPIFYKAFYYINKLCLYAMNRVSAAEFEPRFSGEKEALKFILKKLQNKENIVIFDCGANYGIYTELVLEVFQSFKQRLKIYLFEPSQICFDHLEKVFAKQKDIHLCQVGLSDKTDFAKLYYPWQGAGGSSLSEGVSYAQGTSFLETQSEQVKLIKLDDFCRDNGIETIDYLKLDIEGHELAALKGSNQMLISHKIRFIQIEIGSASLVTKCMLFDIWKMLSHSYSFYLILKHGIVQIDYKADLEWFF